MTAIITPITAPFAWGRSDNVPPATNSGSPDNVANQETGFPVLQMTALSTPGATPVKEQEMNGVINYYTQLLYQLGAGYQFTFNSALSGVLGGYAQGAVLWNAVGNNRQVSLIPNNTYNFVTTPSYIDDGIHWKTVTDTPSIDNPSIHLFNETVQSTVNSAFQARINQIQIVSSDATNGLFSSSYLVTDGLQTAGFTAYWNEALGTRYPQWVSSLITSTNKSISINGYVNGAGQLQSDWFLVSNHATSTVSGGFSLIDGNLPRISGDIPNLIVEPMSAVPMRFFKILSDPTTGINGFAFWNGTVWTVTLGGGALYSGSSTTTFTRVFDINNIFGIVIPSSPTVWDGTCTIDAGGGGTGGIVTTSCTISQGSGASVMLDVSGITNTPKTSLTLCYNIIFQATSLT